jgi:hypothetical protein
MNAQKLVKLAKIGSILEQKGMARESDLINDTLVRLSANWQSIYVDLPMLERKWPFSLVDEDFEDADEQRQNFPRYREKEDVDLSGDDDEEFNSLEVSLHPSESDAGAGVKFIWTDFASSLMQGSNWGKKIQTHDQNNAAGERYKNFLPNLY